MVIASAVPAFSQVLRVGSTAPLFSETGVDGTVYKLTDLRGKVVVLTLWSTRCPICRVELPNLDKVVTLYDPKNVVFLAMSAESNEKVTGFLASHPFRFKSLPNSFGTMLRYADKDSSGVINMPYPSFYVIGRDGRIGFRAYPANAAGYPAGTLGSPFSSPRALAALRLTASSKRVGCMTGESTGFAPFRMRPA